MLGVGDLIDAAFFSSIAILNTYLNNCCIFDTFTSWRKSYSSKYCRPGTEWNEQAQLEHGPWQPACVRQVLVVRHEWMDGWIMDHGSFVLLMLAPGRQSSSCINANVGDARDHECICNAMQCELVLGCRCHLIASPSWERGRQTDASRQPCSYRAVLQIIRWGHGTCPVSLHLLLATPCYLLAAVQRPRD